MTTFETYLNLLGQHEQSQIMAFLNELEERIVLPKKQKREMLEDFKTALLYYLEHDVPVAVALERLSPRKLGGFYARTAENWYPLDSAAKIYPMSLSRDSMSIFRLEFYLKEDVVPQLLQIALSFTVKRFPSFGTTLKKGFFWHYLNGTKRRFHIEEEVDLPCKPIHIGATGSMTFRVQYYKNRISAEFFHVLTDGTGGLVFLSTLVAEYLRLLGAEIAPTGYVLDIEAQPVEEEIRNEFQNVPDIEGDGGVSSFIESPSVQMSGILSKEKPYGVVHLELNGNAVRKTAKKYGATVGAYMLALMFVAGKRCTDAMEGTMQIQVPVNMRKFYGANNLRNLSMYCNIKLGITDITTPHEILPEIIRQLQEKTAEQTMYGMMHDTQKLIHAINWVPLAIKRPIAKMVYGFLGDRVFSNTLSNLGVVRLPHEMGTHIEKISAVLGTSVLNRASCAMATFEDKAVFTISKFTQDPSFEEVLCELLGNDGLVPNVEGSKRYEV